MHASPLITALALATLIPAALPATPAQELKLHTLAEDWFTTRQDRENVDSPAVWHPASGKTASLLLVTAKEGHSINVFDPRNGYFLQRVGGLGIQLGQFNRPNGVWVVGNLLFVVERDNHRVQVLGLPFFNSLGSFGEDDLVKPYGLCVLPDGPHAYKVYVTDNYEDAMGEQVVQTEMGRRVRVYEVEIEGPGPVDADLVGTFGDTQGAGILNTVESIYADPANGRLLIADEDLDTPGGQNVKIYSLDGAFTGQTIGDGIFRFQPEGIALYPTGEKSGLLVLTDQGKTANYFHFFDRETLAYVGTIQGIYTRNTDGIWLDPTPTETFPKGVLYAVDNDACVAAFDMRKVLEALEVKGSR
jgi:3-phytase